MKQRNQKIAYLTRLAVFCAVGALLPQAFHAFGNLPGPIFLPMHLPTLLAGLLQGPLAGAVTGVLSPILSFLLTGGSMPMAVKVPFMCLELLSYGVVSGVMFRLLKPKMPTVASSVIAVAAAQVAGRAVNVLCTVVAVHLLGVTHKAVSVAGAVASIGTGLPGIVIQLVLLPVLVKLLERAFRDDSWLAPLQR